MAIIYGTNGSDYFVPDYKTGPYYYGDTIYLYGGDDFVDSSGGDDYIDAGSGNDRVEAGDGDDQIYGGSGGDFLNGDLGNDVIHGGGGDDVINGYLEDDILYGDTGDDIFLHQGNDGWDSYIGGEGHDVILIDQVSQYSSVGRIKIQYMEGVEQIINNDYKDVDVIIDGSFDLRSLEYSGIRSFRGHDEDDIIIGDNYSNSLYGSAGNDTIDGLGGDDYLVGGEGNDLISGNTGFDTIAGGEGSDTFYFTADQNFDILTDFEDGLDLLVFSGVETINVFEYEGDTAIEFAGDTFVILEDIETSMIDASDVSFV